MTKIPNSILQNRMSVIKCQNQKLKHFTGTNGYQLLVSRLGTGIFFCIKWWKKHGFIASYTSHLYDSIKFHYKNIQNRHSMKITTNNKRQNNIPQNTTKNWNQCNMDATITHGFGIKLWQMYSTWFALLIVNFIFEVIGGKHFKGEFFTWLPVLRVILTLKKIFLWSYFNIIHIIIHKSAFNKLKFSYKSL